MQQTDTPKLRRVAAGNYASADGRFTAEQPRPRGLWIVTDNERGLYTMPERLRDCREWARAIVAGEALMDRIEVVEIENTAGGGVTAMYGVELYDEQGRGGLMRRYRVHRYTNDRGHWYDVEDRGIAISSRERFRYAKTLDDARFTIATRIADQEAAS